MPDHPYLPDLTFEPGDAVSAEFAQRYSDAGASPPARATLTGTLQSARRRVTAAFGRAVLRVTRHPDTCRLAGHPLEVTAWQEFPGHYENWARAIRCQCGAISHIQTVNCHTSPLNLFQPPQDPPT